jgi:hypothetical protein
MNPQFIKVILTYLLNIAIKSTNIKLFMVELAQNEETQGLFEELEGFDRFKDLVGFNVKTADLFDRLLSLNPDVLKEALIKKISNIICVTRYVMDAALFHSELGEKGREAYSTKKIRVLKALRHLVLHTSKDMRELVAADILSKGGRVPDVRAVTALIRSRIKESTGIDSVKLEDSIEKRFNIAKHGLNEELVDVLRVLIDNTDSLPLAILEELQEKDPEKYIHFSEEDVCGMLRLIRRAFIIRDVGLKFDTRRDEATAAVLGYSIIAPSLNKPSRVGRDLGAVQRDKIKDAWLEPGKVYTVTPSSPRDVLSECEVKIVDPKDAVALGKLDNIGDDMICVFCGKGFTSVTPVSLDRITPARLSEGLPSFTSSGPLRLKYARK